MTRDLLKENFPELAEDGALEICIIKVRLEPRSLPDRSARPEPRSRRDRFFRVFFGC